MAYVEPRSGDIFIAWGVSPRKHTNQKGSNPEGVTDNQEGIAAARAVAAVCRPLSGASECCEAWYLGLTPQAKSLSRLRRSGTAPF